MSTVRYIDVQGVYRFLLIVYFDNPRRNFAVIARTSKSGICLLALDFFFMLLLNIGASIITPRHSWNVELSFNERDSSSKVSHIFFNNRATFAWQTRRDVNVNVHQA